MHLRRSEGQGLHLKADPGGVSASHTEAVAQVYQPQPHLAALCNNRHQPSEQTRSEAKPDAKPEAKSEAKSEARLA